MRKLLLTVAAWRCGPAGHGRLCADEAARPKRRRSQSRDGHTAAPAAATARAPSAPEKPRLFAPFKSELEQASYCVGGRHGRGLKRRHGRDIEGFNRGLRDIAAQALLLRMTDRQIIADFRKNLQQGQEHSQLVAQRPRRKATTSWQEQGQGRRDHSAAASSTRSSRKAPAKSKEPDTSRSITTQDAGRTVFDSSSWTGQPVAVPLNRVIKGWTEGIQR